MMLGRNAGSTCRPAALRQRGFTCRIGALVQNSRRAAAGTLSRVNPAVSHGRFRKMRNLTKEHRAARGCGQHALVRLLMSVAGLAAASGNAAPGHLRRTARAHRDAGAAAHGGGRRAGYTGHRPGTRRAFPVHGAQRRYPVGHLRPFPAPAVALARAVGHEPAAGAQSSPDLSRPGPLPAPARRPCLAVDHADRRGRHRQLSPRVRSDGADAAAIPSIPPGTSSPS